METSLTLNFKEKKKGSARKIIWVLLFSSETVAQRGISEGQACFHIKDSFSIAVKNFDFVETRHTQMLLSQDKNTKDASGHES